MPKILIWPFIILQVATVAAIVLFLRMLLYRQLETGMKRIKKIDQENLKKEAVLNEKVERMNREYEEKMIKAEQEAALLVSSAKEDIKKMRSFERMKAKEEAKKIIANALQEREKVLKGAKSEVRGKAVDFAVVLLKHVFSEKELSALRSDAAEEAMDDLLSSDNVRKLLGKGEDIEVTTADELTDKAKEHVQKVIDRHGGSGAKVKFTIDASVLGGLVLRIGESVIDGGIARRIDNAAMELKDEMGSGAYDM